MMSRTRPESSFQRLIGRLRERFADSRKRRVLRESFEGMAPADRDRLLADAGLSGADLHAFERAAPEAERLLGRMLRTLGLTRAAFRQDPSTGRAVEWNCVTCTDRRRCRDWLDGAGPDAAWREFCPNRENFDRLRQRTAA